MKPDLTYQDSDLLLDCTQLTGLAARYGTPLYIYSAASLRSQAMRLMQSLGTIGSLHYAVKANTNPSLLKMIFSMGFGADTVSLGEIQAALDAGCPARNIVFSGVGKRPDELAFALDHDIFINAESEEEIAAIAHLRKGAHIGIRVNPGVDAHTHQYITTGTDANKFGIPADAASRAFHAAADAGLVPDTISCHIGSQIKELEPYRKSIVRLLELRDALMSDGLPISSLDLGGGFGISYENGDDFAVEELETLVRHEVPQGMKLAFEPGRYLIGHAGLLLTRVLYRKQYSKTFVIVDAGMNDLIRPALYQAHHNILPVTRRSTPCLACDVVGPVCESGDFLGKDVQLALPEQGDLLAVCDAGAYGWSMSSTYNSRPRLPEVLIDEGTAELIRSRGA